MLNVYYQLWCEWDVGLDGYLFSSKEAALTYAAAVLPDIGIDDPVAELVEEGLLGTTELVVQG